MQTTGSFHGALELYCNNLQRDIWKVHQQSLQQLTEKSNALGEENRELRQKLLALGPDSAHASDGAKPVGSQQASIERSLPNMIFQESGGLANETSGEETLDHKLSPVGFDRDASLPSSSWQTGTEEPAPMRFESGSKTAVGKASSRNDGTAENPEATVVHFKKDMTQALKRKATSKSIQQESRLQQLANSVVENNLFNSTVSIFIVGSAVALGAHADWQMKNPSSEDPVVFKVLDYSFSVFFLLELVVRLVAERLFFFSPMNASLSWNLFDAVLVSFSFIDEILGRIVIADLLRMLRLLRVVRVARVIRAIRFCSDLRVMVHAVLGSARSLLWASVLLVSIMFMFGVFVMQVAVPLLKVEAVDPDVPAPTTLTADEISSGQTAFVIKKHYGSIARSMFTLFMSVSGGMDWSEAAGPLKEVHWLLEYVFAGYIFFTVFCCLNIVTGIFVDNATELRAADEETMCADALSERRRWIKEVVELFSQFGAADDDGMSFELFQEKLTDIKVQSLFRNLGINTDLTSARELFDLFDFNEGGMIDIDEFATGIQRLNGSARSIDVFKLGRTQRNLKKDMESIVDLCVSMRSELARHAPAAPNTTWATQTGAPSSAE